MTTTGWSGSLFDAISANPPQTHQTGSNIVLNSFLASSFDAERHLTGLNPAQREAVLHNEGPALVLAGAGSGKTRVLTTRIARLIGERKVAPHEVLAVTFTNKAAGEMRTRIASLLGSEPRGMWCGTFHALGARLLRSAAHVVGRESTFTIYDEDDSLAAVKRVMETHRLNPKQFAPKLVLGAISGAKNALVSPDEYLALARDPFSKAVASVFSSLDAELTRSNAVTFDDLLVLPVRALETDTGLRSTFQQKFKYVLVDEYQDTNVAQYRFVQLIASERRNVMVVGDDDQSIYGWRGADIKNILNFEKDFPGARVVRLEENYRSTPNVLSLANAVIAENSGRHGKTLRATRPAGDPVTLIETLDERDEADFIAETILSQTATRKRERRDCAVLYRTNAQSRAIEDAFRRASIPYRLIGAVRFYDRREIRDLIAYLRLVANPSDNEAFRRALNSPKRGLGEATVALLAASASAAGISLLQAASTSDVLELLRPAARTSLKDFLQLIERLRTTAAEASVDELLREIVDATSYMEYLRSEGPEGLDRIENVRELIAGAVETVSDEGGEVGLRPLDVFLQSSTLVAGVDKLDPEADAVVCMTMHNAKGLEFPVVFISGLEDGLFPLSRAIEDEAQLEEERRLFYVGITRAEETLYLTCAEQRRRNGEWSEAAPSRFLKVITPSLGKRGSTARARAEGRGIGAGFGGGVGSKAGYSSHSRFGNTESSWSRASGSGRAKGSNTMQFVGSASRKRETFPSPEDESQDLPQFVVGEKVRHHKFGSGTIAEFTGSGRDAKVRIDFDDAEVGRKTLVLAQAKLERGLE